MIGNTALYQEIGQTLYNSSPDEAVKVIMRATLDISDEGDVGTFEFDYVDNAGDVKWFPFGLNIDTTRLRDLLTLLRQSYLENKQPTWNKCEFILDVITGKFEFNIDYEDGK